MIASIIALACVIEGVLFGLWLVLKEEKE